MEEEIFDDLLAITSDESPTSPEGSINSLNGVHTQGSLKSSRCCDVCAMPIDTKHASIHYGALTCYSCRAFFRRSLQKTRNPNFKCFKDGDCEVNPKSRRKCQKCRFDKCLKAGMRVEMVLTDTQKTLRFRKFLERKKQKDCSVSSSSRDLPSSSGENSCTGGSEDLSSSQSEEISGFAQEQRKMTDSFPGLLDSFQKFHSGASSLNPMDFSTFLGFIASLFQSYALTLPEFQYLDPAEQGMLIESNKHSFMAYILARYFMATSGKEQLNWLFGDQQEVSDQGTGKTTLYYYIPMQSYIDLYQVFAWASESSLKLFLDLSAALRRYDLDFGVTGQLAQCLLFTSDPMVEPSRPVHRAFDKFKNALQNLYPESPVQRLLDIIQDLGMTLLNHSNILTIDISTPSSPSSSSNGSVTWMDAQLLRFKDAFKAVPYGPDLINEMIMHSYGVPVSKSFLPQSVAVWIERALILIQTEPPSSQGTVDATVRAYQFAALHLTMLEACSTGLEQLTFTAGGDDLQVWETKYKPFVRDSSFLALPLKECRVDISRMDLERMCVLQSKLARHVPDMESFITFALVILFENTQSPDWDITDGYLSMWVDRVNCKTEVTTRSTFQSLMGDVKDLASFLQAIHGRLQYT
ncbi:hypothetical protein TCAL_08928 [Tigriopus californicus]|uniref:Nuclear receptor domain-containing protein n=1 Tax=Tigriopus californicus TaxID=6832 RepID=A0A553PP63_TIGCA|nr:uncharacterized protein LOC131882290 isoform X1 [Tigriopus californicus]TRY79465.1 hypothetical protein TCAL_08928 [Tigriopus californicus]|eukprot:TCALIF_08928-PA protein Name:"Similar to NR1H4 Bile acid receptor (Bos taurus)" AED:0.44 eAED:0.44 QI:0/-1/0/1/-1/1/1/0/635